LCDGTLPGYRYAYSVGRGQSFGFLLDHLLAAATDLAFARLGAEAFSFANRAFVPFAKHIHFDSPSLKASTDDYLSTIGWPQQVNVPFSGFVTINSEPHFLQIYFLPIWFAIRTYLLSK